MCLHLIREADNHFVYSFEYKMAKDLVQRDVDE